MPQSFWIEAVGYLGSALVLVSMLMSSVVRLRVINLAGCVIFSVYALIIRSYPTAVMNICLTGINIWHLMKLRKPERHFEIYEDSPGSAWIAHMLAHYRDDIALHFPEFGIEALRPDDRVFMVLEGGEAAGILIGTPDGGCLDVTLDYATPVYRDCSVGRALYAALPAHGIRTLVWQSQPEAHAAYLQRMGFAVQPDGSSRLELA